MQATVDITSRYDGIVTKLYYQVGEIAKVGSPLMQIDVEDGADDEAAGWGLVARAGCFGG